MIPCFTTWKELAIMSSFNKLEVNPLSDTDIASTLSQMASSNATKISSSPVMGGCQQTLHTIDEALVKDVNSRDDISNKHTIGVDGVLDANSAII